MFNLGQFISTYITKRPSSMFAPDIEANKMELSQEIKGKSICVIGSVESIGYCFIKTMAYL